MHNRCCNLLSMSKLTYLIQLCLIYTKEVIMFVKGLPSKRNIHDMDTVYSYKRNFKRFFNLKAYMS